MLAYGTVALLALLLSFPAAGQGIGTFKARLARPGESTDAVVTVREYGSAVEAVRRYDNSDRPTEIPGYRIRIFFDNGQNARSEFPGIPTFLVYENPSYIVTVGNCITIDEALMLWDRVRKSFSTAFLWRGSIPVEELLREEPVPVPESGLQADTVAAVTRVLPY